MLTKSLEWRAVKSIRGVIGFVQAVEAGSFAGAAKRLGITPVAVSKNVQRLERELGVRLLQRSTRKLLNDRVRGEPTTSAAPARCASWESVHAAIGERGPVAYGHHSR
jgi:DNA-binding transcriptional LysR family regulator